MWGCERKSKKNSQGARGKDRLLGESILTITSSSPPDSELESSLTRLGRLLCDDGGRSSCVTTSSSNLFLTVVDPSDFTVVRVRLGS